MLLTITILTWVVMCHGFLHNNNDEYQVWLTTGDGSKKLHREAAISTSNSGQGYSVWVDRRKRRQSMEGFGGSLTNAAASVIYHSPNRAQIMRDLFGLGVNDLGISFLRVVMGGSDFQAVSPYTYDDLWNNHGSDFNMDNFSIQKDRAFFIPIIKQALSINPNLKILATPWTAPAWMKTSHSMFGGDLNGGDNYLSAYAKYFVKFIRAYRSAGIPVHYLSLQNEPLLSRNSYPTMTVNVELMKRLIRDHVGPAFRQNNIQTKLLIFDHNWDAPWYPEQILSDSNAKQYVSGVAWHGYAGRHDTPNWFHDKHPDVGMFFTEISGGDWDTNFASTLTWDTRIIFIGQTKAWAKSVALWNIALDEHHGPRVGVNGCTNCRGVITVPSGGGYTKNVEYYAMGHMSRFVKPGAVRLETNNFGWDDLQAVAFVNPDGTTVIVVQNPSTSKSASFSLDIDAKHYHYNNLPPQSVVTFVK
ncbi:uncharacterized protein LOC127862038 isoform X2 [Dreissena polymorpha]|uniref:uncharacterized protein LOC127862038 isoform X2 n=1 Tax=Dreissena polymorpha TaxID=45954 RepID=UPI0022643C20|nr:uncharacterized protein LOC127862038 isoform X2 [Dreissena polymorpha]